MKLTIGIPLVWAVVCAGLVTPAAAQVRSEVELPLTTYDRLRAAAKVKKEPRETTGPFASARLVQASIAIDLAARRATWQAEIDVTSGGDEPPAVPLLLALSEAPVDRSSVSGASARLETADGKLTLQPEEAGVFRVSLGGELAGVGQDETAGIVFSVPRLQTLPAAFEVSAPEGVTLASTASSGGELALAKTRPGGVAARLTTDPVSSARLVVRRSGPRSTGPALVEGSLSSVARLSEDAVRHEVRLSLTVKRGTLESRTLSFPGGSLVSATGPVIASEPDADGTLRLRFEPPVHEKGQVFVTLSFLSPRDPKADVYSPPMPRMPLLAGERLEKRLAVVADGGLLVQAVDEQDWTATPDLGDVRVGPDDVALAFTARREEPRPLRLSLKRLGALSVASALARVSLGVLVGETGETRMRVVSDVRTRGRSSLRFRIPPDAVLLAARVGGEVAAASRPAPETLEVPIRGESGTTRVELLLAGSVRVPADGEKLTLPPAAPDEPLERVSWSLVLPPGLAVKEEGRRLPSPGEPPVARPDASPQVGPGDQAALELAKRLAAADHASLAGGPWSPRASLPDLPLAYATDLVDVAEGITPLTVTIKARTEKEPWF